jgi:hypothetical protein
MQLGGNEVIDLGLIHCITTPRFPINHFCRDSRKLIKGNRFKSEISHLAGKKKFEIQSIDKFFVLLHKCTFAIEFCLV